MTPDVDDFLKEVSVVFPVRGDVIRTALAAAEQRERDADRMTNTLYAEPLLDWVREHYALYLQADPSECGVDHDVAMKLLIARANLTDGAMRLVIDRSNLAVAAEKRVTDLEKENADLRKRFASLRVGPRPAGGWPYEDEAAEANEASDCRCIGARDSTGRCILCHRPKR